MVVRREFGTGGTGVVQPRRLVEVTESPVKDIKILAMKNPAKNVLSSSLMNDLLDVISELCTPDKESCRGVVLTSALVGAFSAGLDLKLLHASLEYEIFTHYWSQLQKLYVTLNTLPVPLVSAINGDAIGAGCIIALASDYRIMAARAEEQERPFKIGINATKCGLTVPPSFAALTSYVVGHRRCEALLQLGELVDAPTAKTMGLVDEIVENADEVLIPALDMAERLSSAASWCYWTVKDVSRRRLVAPFCTPALRNAECSNYYEMLNNPDVKRDLGAYLGGS
ncbi:3,2-trans-enoyl-CoA isomerase, mitochondrial precursor [Trypanosoma rangeli]|uniref:3,2-trans-enoyl-CoA isomerase, mitochondrial n=1 Tax=Trypanosoma rangeli TaxID=5698 RepID=A0A422NUW6_TRYRA|nr:3,2-trans-enoyl-CoA isomerase, mitochondrial precursor [Trypanosoma rangeli]RNF09261.1 3,2-trans-enoyl-CoA isomerase, mitochondrial precursor [Trypanosoma rangeli]|eukprot:RNF09261.1 3,2-trans-enoyl-CoA isomerase, mitochondrial precursor [Trypanosoma rangeli]